MKRLRRKQSGWPVPGAAQNAVLRVMWPVVAVMVAVSALFAVFAWRSVSSRLPAPPEEPETHIDSLTDLQVPLSELQPGAIRFFSYPAESSGRVRLMVQRTAEGTLHAAFTQCARCAQTSSRSYQEHGKLMCGMCRKPMPLIQAEENARPTCPVTKLPLRLHQGFVIVRRLDILRLASMYPEEAIRK